MKRSSFSRVLLVAASTLLLSNFAVLAKDAPAGLTDAEKKQAKVEAKTKQQLKDLVKHQRTKSGWLGDGTVAENVRVIKDIAYVGTSVSPSQKLDLYIPSVLTIEDDERGESKKTKSNFSAKRKNLSSGWPLVVWIHGGGWRGGDKKGGPYRPLLDAGFAVASINYRLSGEAKWPAQLDDCRSALSYLRAHAQEYDVDAKRMCIWGGSAGGHLVLMLALKNENPPPYDIAAVCDWFGPTDLARFTMPDETTKEGQELVPQLFGLEGDALKSACAAASPITYIGKSRHVAPILIMHGKSDNLVSIKQSQRFVDQMRVAGYKDVKLDEVNGGHGYPGFGPDVIRNVIAFFKDKLEK